MKHVVGRFRFHVASIACLAALIFLSIGAAPGVAETGPDYAITNGWFFSQTGGGDGKGYAVRDLGTDSSGKPLTFWSEFTRLGGTDTLGYPIGQPYVGPDGFTYQPFQRGILQWRPEMGGAVLANTFQTLESAGKDGWLLNMKGVPLPIVDDGSGGDFAKAVATRMSWLTNADIKSKYLANPNPQAIADWNDWRAMELYGLPMSRPEKHGPFITQRFQRGALQLWVEDVPTMPAKGSVVGILGGDMMKEAGLLPASALQPLGPGGAALAQPTPTPVPAQPTPTPITSSYSWRVTQVAAYPNCGTTYIRAFARNASGTPVNGITIKSWNDWGNEYVASTRNHNGSDGYWDRIIGPGPHAGKWYVMLVDGEGRQSSDIAVVNHTASCDPSQGAVQEVELEFKSR